ncbi:hypothetical protein FA09DRAFT_204135 [Tilletiopsis washingtonensis]|uniref:Uncharacterized protein n=1 Tax=Tilletiopsis washingtonensis TaxID=58919 RepID=A0A316ZIC3_9BASI|nr:hypothetical protein FA09DRAFT_204135 [Tilletiopsis washingtonensis]PWO00066.1 hypothetical protein FA09DRAFT_204135 [Tilletiopsis washingtonensis]
MRAGASGAASASVPPQSRVTGARGLTSAWEDRACRPSVYWTEAWMSWPARKWQDRSPGLRNGAPRRKGVGGVTAAARRQLVWFRRCAAAPATKHDSGMHGRARPLHARAWHTQRDCLTSAHGGKLRIDDRLLLSPAAGTAPRTLHTDADCIEEQHLCIEQCSACVEEDMSSRRRCTSSRCEIAAHTCKRQGGMLRRRGCCSIAPHAADSRCLHTTRSWASSIPLRMLREPSVALALSVRGRPGRWEQSSCGCDACTCSSMQA